MDCTYQSLFNMRSLGEIAAAEERIKETAEVFAYHFDRDGDATNDSTIASRAQELRSRSSNATVLISDDMRQSSGQFGGQLFN